MKTSHENIVNGFNFGDLPITITFVAKIESKEWSHYLWHVGIKAPNGETYSIDYKTGLGLIVKQNEFQKRYNRPVKPKIPINSDIIYSLLMDMNCGLDTFEDFCGNCGYDEDSRKAMDIYLQCQNMSKIMTKCFSGEQIEAIQTALEDY